MIVQDKHLHIRMNGKELEYLKDAAAHDDRMGLRRDLAKWVRFTLLSRADEIHDELDDKPQPKRKGRS